MTIEALPIAFIAVPASMTLGTNASHMMTAIIEITEPTLPRLFLN
jgi:hypothetical protein